MLRQEIEELREQVAKVKLGEKGFKCGVLTQFYC